MGDISASLPAITGEITALDDTLDFDIPALTSAIEATVHENALALVLDTNLQAKAATTQYTAFPVNSMAMVNGKILAAAESGLFQNTGDHDGSDQIDAFFELPTMDFGIKQVKRLRFIYLSVETSAATNLTITVSTELGKTQTITIPIAAAGQHAIRETVTRKVYGRYFTIQVRGNNFSIDEIKVLPVVLNHGRNRN